MPYEPEDDATLTLTSALVIAQRALGAIEAPTDVLRDRISSAKPIDGDDYSAMFERETQQGLLTQRFDMLAYLGCLAEIRSRAEFYLHILVSNAIKTGLSKQRDIANAAGVSLFTAQSWAAANKAEIEAILTAKNEEAALMHSISLREDLEES
jgi:hypothetical protein